MSADEPTMNAALRLVDLRLALRQMTPILPPHWRSCTGQLADFCEDVMSGDPTAYIAFSAVSGIELHSMPLDDLIARRAGEDHADPD